jgi:hypothetical protein
MTLCELDGATRNEYVHSSPIDGTDPIFYEAYTSTLTSSSQLVYRSGIRVIVPDLC